MDDRTRRLYGDETRYGLLDDVVGELKNAITRSEGKYPLNRKLADEIPPHVAQFFRSCHQDPDASLPFPDSVRIDLIHYALDECTFKTIGTSEGPSIRWTKEANPAEFDAWISRDNAPRWILRASHDHGAGQDADVAEAAIEAEMRWVHEIVRASVQDQLELIERRARPRPPLYEGFHRVAPHIKSTLESAGTAGASIAEIKEQLPFSLESVESAIETMLMMRAVVRTKAGTYRVIPI